MAGTAIMIPHMTRLLKAKGFLDAHVGEEDIADLWEEHFPQGRQIRRNDDEGAAR